MMADILARELRHSKVEKRREDERREEDEEDEDERDVDLDDLGRFSTEVEVEAVRVWVGPAACMGELTLTGREREN